MLLPEDRIQCVFSERKPWKVWEGLGLFYHHFMHVQANVIYNTFNSSIIGANVWQSLLMSLTQYTVVSRTLQVCQRGGWALLTVSAFNHERAPTSCLQRLEALKANNWTQNNVQQNHQQLRSRVLTAHSTLNCTMWRWAYCSSQLVSRLPPH